MTSLSPATADIARTVITDGGDAAIACVQAIIASWPDYEEKPIKGSGSLGIITADDIECDTPRVCAHQPLPKLFVHVPTVTLTRGDDTTVINGPIETTKPRMTDATRAGWERWFDDLAAHNASMKSGCAAFNRQVYEYFDNRKATQEAEREARYQRACDRALAQGKALPPRSVRKAPPENWHLFVKDKELRAKMRAASNIQYRAGRLRRYVSNGGPVAGRNTARFVEEFKDKDGRPVKALRTALGTISLDLFNSALPTRSMIIYGHDKTTVYDAFWEGTDGMRARDMPYIESDRSRRSLFVVDLDGWWPSIKALRRALRKFLAPEFMPNIISYRGSEEKGGVENPHLIWLLPPGARVCLWARKGKKKADRKTTAKQCNIHSMVQKGIVSHLIPLGADPDHHNVWKFKNPLAPGWSINVCDDSFATMDEWRTFLPTITPDHREMKRRAKVIKAARLGVDPDDVTLSSAIFNDGVVSRRLLIRAAQATKDPNFVKAVESSHHAFVDWLYHQVDGVVTRRLIKQHGDTLAVRSVIHAQREFVEQLQLTPAEASQFADRGRDHFINRYKKQELGPNASAEEREDQERARKAEAGRRSRAAAQELSCGLIAEEIERRIAAGVEVTKTEVVKSLVKAGTVSRSVAYTHFDEVHAVVLQAARYQAVCSDLQSSCSGSQINDTLSDSQVLISGGESTVVEPRFDVGMIKASSNPDQTIIQNSRHIPESELTRLYRSHAKRESWRAAVSAWRKEHQHVRSGGDLPDLDDDDPIIRAAMLINGAAWSCSRRTLH